ncbi:hypothetical protein BS78_02G322000 [Paspalum vaginatum]|nr:hypothetical protein BS78_02G322000 [Paspalum vaginatum]
MSSSARDPCFGHLPVQERLGYVQCNLCATILLVGVPCGGRLQLMKTVAVQCGSCGGILSVALPPPTAASVELPLQEPGGAVDPPPPRDSDESSGEDREAVAENRAAPVVNKPPVRKQRTPSAYNRFIKEEIRRIKEGDPSITHKEAFSAASKNWARLPRIQQTGD